MQLQQILQNGIIGYHSHVKAITFYYFNNVTRRTYNLLTIWKLIDSPVQPPDTKYYNKLTSEVIWGRHTYFFDKSELVSKLGSIVGTQSLNEREHIVEFDELATSGPHGRFISRISRNRIRNLFDWMFGQLCI